MGPTAPNGHGRASYGPDGPLMAPTALNGPKTAPDGPFLRKRTAESLSLSQNRKKATKGVIRCLKTPQGALMAVKGAPMAPKDAFCELEKKVFIKSKFLIKLFQCLINFFIKKI